MYPVLLVLVSEYVLFAVTLFLGMNSLWRCFPETGLSCFTAHAQVLHSSPSGLHTPWENRDITHNKTPNRVGHWTIFFSVLASGDWSAKEKMCMCYKSINLGFGWCQQVPGFSSVHAPIYEKFRGILGICEAVSSWHFAASVFWQTRP